MGICQQQKQQGTESIYSYGLGVLRFEPTSYKNQWNRTHTLNASHSFLDASLAYVFAPHSLIMPTDIPSRMASASRSWKRPIPVSGRSSEEPGEMDVDPVQPGTPLIFTHTTTRPQPSLASQLTSFQWESQPSNAIHAPTVHYKPLPKTLQTHAACSPHPTRCDLAMPPRHTRLPHAFMPTTHRFTPYMRIMTSPPPPISLTVRQREPTRNECRIRRDQVSTSASTNIVTGTPSLASFVTSLKASSKALSGQSSSASPDTGDSRSSYTGPSTPNPPTNEPLCDFLVEAESSVSKSDMQIDMKSKQ